MQDHLASDKITKSEYNQVLLDIMGQVQSIDTNPMVTVNTNGSQKDIPVSQATMESYNRTAFLDDYPKKDLKSVVDTAMVAKSDYDTFQRWKPVLKRVIIALILLLSGGSIASIFKTIFL